METIKFSYNWNNKLNGTIFTTIRRTPKKENEIVEIYLKDKYLFNAKVLSCREVYYRDLLKEKEIILTDTGIPTIEKFDDLVKKMYKDLTPYTKMYVILLKKEEQTLL